MRDFSRWDDFLTALASDVYPETPSELHNSITGLAIRDLLREGIIQPGMRVLDVGCGQGLALEVFREAGVSATGITLGSDYEVCRGKGFDVQQMDQNFMIFADGGFDFLWCRHVLEHSVAPLFTLSEYRRVTKPGGRIYVEVPAPDTAAHHERNPNHYSVLALSSWISLFERSGLVMEKNVAIDIPLTIGPDRYWSFLLKTPG